MAAKPISARTAGRLKDEVYRQMLRVEAGHAAAIPLALAVLRAWSVCEGQSTRCELKQWLRRVSPICLHMIEDSDRTKPRS